MPNRFKSRYNFDKLEVGDTFEFSLRWAGYKQVQQAAINFGKRNGGRKFAFRRTKPGMAECRRVA